MRTVVFVVVVLQIKVLDSNPIITNEDWNLDVSYLIKSHIDNPLTNQFAGPSEPS